jgi:hypothetical protein
MDHIIIRPGSTMLWQFPLFCIKKDAARRVFFDAN